MPISQAKTRFWRSSDLSAGYTLLELLVVVAIISLLLSVAPAIYSRIIPGYQVRQFSNELANYMRSLREKARTKGTTETIVFLRETEGIKTEGTGLTPPSDMAVIYEPNEIWRNTDANRLMFFDNGASNGGKVTLKRGNLSVVLHVDWVSGSVEVQQ